MKIPLLLLAAAAATLLAAAPAASAADYVKGQVIVAKSASVSSTGAGGAEVVQTQPGETVAEAIKRLKQTTGIRYAVPNYVAHASGFVPNEPGIGAQTQWTDLQWNFVGPYGVDAPGAGQQATRARAPGGRGVTVAVLDTGVTYENRGRFRRNPALSPTRFVRPYD